MPDENRFDLEDWRRKTESQYERLIRIGDRVFGETNTPPAHMFPPAQSNPRPVGAKLIGTVEDLSLKAARARMAFDLPTWIPDGFALEPAVRMPRPPEQALPKLPPGMTLNFPVSVHLMWRRTNGHWLGLDIRPVFKELGAVTNMPMAVSPNGVKEVSVNGQPAALISKMWVTHMNTLTGEESGPQAKSDVVHLEWKLNDVDYTLRTGAGHLTEVELVRVAESIQ